MQVQVVFTTELGEDALSYEALLGTYTGLYKAGDAVGYIRPGEDHVRFAPADCVVVVTVQVPA